MSSVIREQKGIEVRSHFIDGPLVSNGYSYTTCIINNSKFTFFFNEQKSNNSVKINLSGHNIVFISPIESSGEVTIKAASAIFLSTISAPNGVKIDLNRHSISLGGMNLSNASNLIASEAFFRPEFDQECISRIRDIFLVGINRREGNFIVDALSEVYASIRSIQDPDLTKVFKFFAIDPIPRRTNRFQVHQVPL